MNSRHASAHAITTLSFPSAPFPTIIPSGCPYAAGELYAAATSDKKRSGSGIDVVVLEQVGQAKTVRLDMEGLRAFTEAAL